MQDLGINKGKVIALKGTERGHYFRIIADVYVDGKSLAEILIAEGIGRPVNGEKRRSWCK